MAFCGEMEGRVGGRVYICWWGGMGLENEMGGRLDREMQSLA